MNHRDPKEVAAFIGQPVTPAEFLAAHPYTVHVPDLFNGLSVGEGRLIHCSSAREADALLKQGPSRKIVRQPDYLLMDTIPTEWLR